jgi:hypothetical protein
MALIKPEQLRSGSYTISGSFSGSFFGDGSGLTNLSINTGSFTTTSSFNSFTSSYYVDSSSFSTRVTNLENFSSSLDATFATDAELNVATASLSASISYLSSSFETFSGSYNTGSFTGSFTGSLQGTASWANNAITSSYVTLAQTASYVETAQTASYVLNAISSSYALQAVSASYASNSLSSSFATTASYVTPLYQQILISGSLKLDPTQDPDPTGIDLDSTVLFQSSSNTPLGYDLYFRQNGNLVKWKWVEGNLNTGLLYGGVVTYSGSNVLVSPGSGIIVNHNAVTGSEISPIVEYVTWSAITQSITNIATQQVTYLYIDNTGTLQQQSTRFTTEEYHDYIPLGAVGHFDYTQVSAFGGQVQTAYDQVSQISSFVDAFGPLKVSGYGITGQAGTLQLSVGSGISFIHGGFYENDPEMPSQISTPSQATASFAYVFRSGSGAQFDINGGNLYTSLRPGFYDPGTGITGSVSNNDWTIQHVYADPKTGVLYIYYGQTIYPDYLTAVSSLSTDPFTEGDTFDFTTFIGFLILKSNTSDITNTTDNKIVPAGLFRGSGQGSGGGVSISNLDDLTDVSITSPINGEALIYNAGIWQNGNPTSASFAQTASYVLQAVSASYSLTASYLDNYIPPFPYTGSAIISGSLTVIDGNQYESLNTEYRRLLDINGRRAVDWGSRRFLLDSAETTVVDWDAKEMLDSSGAQSINWDSRDLLDTNGNPRINWSYTAGGIDVYAYTRNYFSGNNNEDLANQSIYTTYIPTGEIIQDVTFDNVVVDYDLVYLDTDNTWYPVDMTTSSSINMLGIAYDIGNTNSVLIEGTTVVNDSALTDSPQVSSIQTGTPIYVNTTTAGIFMSTTVPSTAGNYVRLLGYAYYRSTGDSQYWLMKFKPSNDWYEI